MTELRVLTDVQVGELVDYGEAIDVVEQAFLDFGRGRAVMPPKVYLSFPDYEGDLRAMPSAIGDRYAGVKLVNSHARNPARGLPSVIGTYMLFSQETGMPLCLMAATLLTAIRTGAASGVATKHLARQDASTLGLIGAGVQAPHQLRAVTRVREIESVALWAPLADRERTDAAARAMSGEFPELRIEVVDEVEGAAGADVLCTTTPSRGPLFPAAALRPGAHINAVGADGPGKQELDPAILTQARVIVDEMDQAVHGGEVNVAIHAGLYSPERIAGTLSDVIAGKLAGRESEEETTIFDSTGLAIQDIAVAVLVYERAVGRGVGTFLEL